MSKIAMARAWAHKITDMERHDDKVYQEVSVQAKTNHPDLGWCYVGEFVCGPRMLYVHFPVADIRPATAVEVHLLTRSSCGRTLRPPLGRGDIATQAELDALPVKAFKKFA